MMSAPEPRQLLKQKLASYQKMYPEESIGSKFLELLTEKDCFSRSRKEGHITGSAWVYNKKETHVLLTHHKKLNMWLQLGGHADGDEDIIRVARREAVEESGISDLKLMSNEILDLDIHLIPARKNETEHYHYDIRFLFKCESNENFLVSDESHDLAWVDITNLTELTKEQSMHRMLRKSKFYLV